MLEPRRLAVAVLALVLALAAPRALAAQAYFGGQANWGSETDFGLGARVLGDIEGTDLEAVGSFDLYFPDGPADFWEINANLFYHFDLPENPSVLPYAGGGLNVANISNGGGHTEVGLNVAGGVRFPGRTVTPFVEGRAVVSDFDQVVLTAGLIFGMPGGGS